MASNSKMCYDVGMRCGHPSAHTYGLLLEKEFFMETYNDQLFPPAFLVNYTKEPAGRPVSYTHLDVYKRQPFILMPAAPFILMPTAPLTHIRITTRIPRRS